MCCHIKYINKLNFLILFSYIFIETVCSARLTTVVHYCSYYYYTLFNLRKVYEEWSKQFLLFAAFLDRTSQSILTTADICMWFDANMQD